MDRPATRVLVVDDEPQFRSLVTELLIERGFDARPAPDARAALDLAADRSFGVAVLDLVMPDIGGIELAEKIKQVSPETQVLILTGQGDMGSAIDGLRHGVFDYLQKGDLDIPRLARSVTEAGERSRLIRENHELLTRLQESNRLLKALHDVAAGIAGEPHVDRVLDKLMIAARILCHAAAGRVLLFGRRPGDDLFVTTGAGAGADALRGARLHPDESIAALVARDNQAVVVSRPREHPRYSNRLDEMPPEHPGLVCAPLRHGAVFGTVCVAGPEEGEFSNEDRDLLAILARQAAVGIDNALNHERSINFFTHTSDMLVSILDGMDTFYEGHSRAVARLADMVTRRLGLGDAERRNVHFGALLHDIGKIRVDQSILKAKGFDSEEQRREMRQHPTFGLQMLQPITMWEEVLPIVHGHHERWDGKGYPRGLAGEEISLGARIVAVAEVFDVMTRQTPHGPRRTTEEALAELERCAGTQFDPALVRVFVAEYREQRDQLPNK
jgi:putative nucleotidyltransferase with HDIG domain